MCTLFFKNYICTPTYMYVCVGVCVSLCVPLCMNETSRANLANCGKLFKQLFSPNHFWSSPLLNNLIIFLFFLSLLWFLCLLDK